MDKEWPDRIHKAWGDFIGNSEPPGDEWLKKNDYEYVRQAFMEGVEVGAKFLVDQLGGVIELVQAMDDSTLDYFDDDGDPVEGGLFDLSDDDEEDV